MARKKLRGMWARSNKKGRVVANRRKIGGQANVAGNGYG